MAIEAKTEFLQKQRISRLSFAPYTEHVFVFAGARRKMEQVMTSLVLADSVNVRWQLWKERNLAINVAL